jgi:general secretion pathway protein D
MIHGKPYDSDFDMTRQPNYPSLRPGALLATLLIAGCAGVGGGPTTMSDLPAAKPGSPEQTAAKGTPAAEADKKPESARLFKGTGVLVKPPKPEAAPAGGNTSLNFEAADVRDIAKTVLAEILKESYIVDPKVTGSISFRTTRPLPREALLPTLETVLRMNGIVMVKENGIYKIMPIAGVKGSLSPRMGAPLSGYSLQVVPLKYAGSRELAKILEAIAPDPSAVKADELRNLLILAGTQNEIQHMLDTVEMFDVDWLSGMSVGLFILQSADVKSVDKELASIFSDKSLNPLAGAVRIIPIERLNGFVIITPQAHYLDQAKLWLERLDRAGGTAGTRLFVYQVQNGKAEHLAELLNQTFGGKQTQTTQPRPAAQVATGLQPTEIRSSNRSPLGSSLGSATTAQQPAAAAVAGAQVTGSTLTISDEAGGATSEVRVVADKENNALLILANSAGYEKIETALKKLDTSPRQVLIEVTIAEVTLKDELKYGVEWNFTNGPRKSGYLDTDGKSGVGQLIPGFSYALALADGTGLQAALNMLALDNRINILSSPHIMVADNQTAKIQVGDSVPTQTSATTALATTTTTGTVTSTIQYLDTGVMLSVTPRINAGGLVNLDITQEVSNASATTTSSLNSPTISKRSTKTQVQVQSGETMVLGGLISEKGDNTNSGLPGLSSIPILGGLFGTQARNNTKTELVMLITPRVANNSVQAKQISNELQRKMGEAKNLIDCGTSNVLGYSTRGGLWCLQPGRFDGKIDRMNEFDADGQAVYLKQRPDPAARVQATIPAPAPTPAPAAAPASAPATASPPAAKPVTAPAPAKTPAAPAVPYLGL